MAKPTEPYTEPHLAVQWIPQATYLTPEQPLEYGITASPYGEALWGFTAAGLCHLSLHNKCTDPIKELQKRWPGQDYQVNQTQAEALHAAVQQPTTQPIPVWLTGTTFQIQVWQGLLHIRTGETISYQQLAARIGKPKAVRAVGSALGKNPIAWLIPCHRVVRQTGDIGQYHWGSARKAAMIQAEQHLVGNNNMTISVNRLRCAAI